MGLTLRFRKGSLLLILLTGMSGNAVSQDFIDGIYLYNHAQYDSLIFSHAPSFIRDNPNREGLARYFLGESFYNKALLASSSGLFQKARAEFMAAGNSSRLKQEFEEYYHFAKYKMGWCSFRLAELNVNPLKNLQRASSEFLDFEPGVPDSIKTYSNFMAAESQVIYNNLRFYELLEKTGDSAEIVASYQSIDKLYDEILGQAPSVSSPQSLDEIHAVTAIRKQMLDFYLGKLYSNLPGLNRQTGAAHFDKIRYDSVLTGKGFAEQFQPAVSYLNLMKYQSRYFIDQTEKTQQDFFDAYSKIATPEFQPEILFRRAGLYQSNPDIESREFNDFSMSFYESAAQKPESYYWLAYIQMIQGRNDQSRENIQKYLELEDGRYLNFRKQILMEDALYRKYLLDFESLYLANEMGGLRNLAAEIQSFLPSNRVIKARSKQLNLLINCSVRSNTAQIWSQVLTGTDEEKLEQALGTIRFVLPRAALNIGVTREKYLTLLNRLLEITENRRNNETLFFKGIVKSLEAEIQAIPDDKIEKFKEAEATFSSIDRSFAFIDEAEYIRARCLFFAEEFDEAERILRKLVNEHFYLRAVFYLAEIFRTTNNGMAAQKCYEFIINKLRDTKFDLADFWLLNARAGLASADDTGGLEVLDGLDLQGAEFQPELYPDLLAYEKLAEEKFVVQQLARESAGWLMKYGLPQKEIYASKNRLPHSFFIHENIFESLLGIIDEVRRPITSSLSLIVLGPEDAASKIEVLFDGESLESTFGVYIKQDIPLNSEHELVVRNSDCYEFMQVHRFAKPGENKQVAVLNQRLTYSQTGRLTNLLQDRDYFFSSRRDANFILNKIPQQDQNSELLVDFANKYELRDCAFDKAGNRILAVNSEENQIWIYSNDALSKRTGTLQISEENLLQSPEGIALDSEGNIYIADWSNHRVAIIDNAGKSKGVIGSFGANASVTAGNPIKLTFPTRLAVLEDTAGADYNGQTYYREKYLYIADRAGIHICKLDGTYLDTLIFPDGYFPEGSFYGFNVADYGEKSKLNLVNRQREMQGRVFEFVAN